MKQMMILADDLTGALDTGAFPVSCNKEVLVYTNVAAYGEDARDRDVISINMASRIMSKEEAYRVHFRLSQEIEDYKGDIIKKLDMGFRGNPATEIEALLNGLGRDCCFILPALPDFNTFTLYGYQYVKGCILQESVYKNDPIHKPFSSYVPEIFSKTCSMKVDAVNIDEVKGESLPECVAEKIASGAKIIIFDAVSNEDCSKIVNTLSTVYPSAIWAGTLGLLQAVTMRLFGNLLPFVHKIRDIKSACFSGTKYDATAEQIRQAAQGGLQIVHLDIDAAAESPAKALEQAAQSCVEANRRGDFVVVPKVSQNCAVPDLHNFITHAMAECAQLVLGQVNIQRVAIIGGETAAAIFGKFNVTKLLLKQKPESGIASGIFEDGALKGLEFATKGGSVGTVHAFEKMLCK